MYNTVTTQADFLQEKLLPGPAPVRRVAHLSDLHVLAPLRRQAWGQHLVSIGRPLDAFARRAKVKRALTAAARSGADHIVVSGDLTEMGTDRELETFAEMMDEARLDPDKVTLVPGNHDAYTTTDAFSRALDGPLKAFRRCAAEEHGKVVDLGHMYLLPLDVTRAQPVTRSAGEISADGIRAVAGRMSDPTLKKKPVLVVQHHPPFEHARKAWQWIDGLIGASALAESFARHERVQVLHGHLHKAVDKVFGVASARAFGAAAVVDDDEDVPRVRLYEWHDGALGAAGMA
jgi:3',5'-cyclic AMP phosphodiesterase CpdA